MNRLTRGREYFDTPLWVGGGRCALGVQRLSVSGGTCWGLSRGAPAET